jgi:putative membrane protein insertion efficiency factor
MPDNPRSGNSPKVKKEREKKSLLYRFYKAAISPVLHSFFGGGCRFVPTCSDYAEECFKNLPAHKALIKSTWRILRCSPRSKGGIDLPPGKK